MTEKIKPDKPFKTFEEQIQILKDRKLIIKNDKFAKHALLTYSYYDLINGYKECFMVDDQFRPNMSIEYLYAFCRFDHAFQNIIFPYSIIIETKFKTVLAYVISKNLGVFQDDYLSKENYFRGAKNKSDVNKILNKVKYSYEGKYIDEPTKHYLNTKNHIPAWILLKNVTFNNTINLYSILKIEDKLEVIDIMLKIQLKEDQKLEVFKNSLSIIRKFRNKIAHNLKFITYRSGKIFLSKKVLSNTPYNVLFDKKTYNSAYSMLISIYILLDDYRMIFELTDSLAKLFGDYFSFSQDIVNDYCKITEIPIDIPNKILNCANNLLSPDVSIDDYGNFF